MYKIFVFQYSSFKKMSLHKLNTFELGINLLKLKRKYHEMGMGKLKLFPKKSKSTIAQDSIVGC